VMRESSCAKPIDVLVGHEHPSALHLARQAGPGKQSPKRLPGILVAMWECGDNARLVHAGEPILRCPNESEGHRQES
jgi:hypothetical protein